MKTVRTVALLVALAFAGTAWSQTEAQLLCKWKTEDETIVEMYKCGNDFCIKQLQAKKEGDKKNDGKAIAKGVKISGSNKLQGTVINPENGKEYNGSWIVSDDRKTLTLKVKWGFLSFSEKWTKVE